MVAGTLADSGYFMGDTLMDANEANPKGYFESREVEAINDAVIRTMLKPQPWEYRVRWIRPLPRQPDFKQAESWAKVRWLALVPPNRVPEVMPEDQTEIARLTAQTPFCFKDPRFCYTLPVWRDYLRDTVFICVFRHPAITATSILKEVEREPYMRGITYDYDQALQMWLYMYRHILERHHQHGTWLFLHYDQVLTPAGLDQIERFTESKVNRSFPTEDLKRTQTDRPIPWSVRRVYRRLCRLAQFR